MLTKTDECAKLTKELANTTSLNQLRNDVKEQRDKLCQARKEYAKAQSKAFEVLQGHSLWDDYNRYRNCIVAREYITGCRAMINVCKEPRVKHDNALLRGLAVGFYFLKRSRKEREHESYLAKLFAMDPTLEERLNDLWETKFDAWIRMSRESELEEMFKAFATFGPALSLKEMERERTKAFQLLADRYVEKSGCSEANALLSLIRTTLERTQWSFVIHNPFCQLMDTFRCAEYLEIAMNKKVERTRLGKENGLRAIWRCWDKKAVIDTVNTACDKCLEKLDTNVGWEECMRMLRNIMLLGMKDKNPTLRLEILGEHREKLQMIAGKVHARLDKLWTIGDGKLTKYDVDKWRTFVETRATVLDWYNSIPDGLPMERIQDKCYHNMIKSLAHTSVFLVDKSTNANSIFDVDHEKLSAIINAFSVVTSCEKVLKVMVDNLIAQLVIYWLTAAREKLEKNKDARWPEDETDFGDVQKIEWLCKHSCKPDRSKRLCGVLCDVCELWNTRSGMSRVSRRVPDMPGYQIKIRNAIDELSNLLSPVNVKT